jgi:peptidyl-prolyl cis-trans isomerase B (cyclophilin B)
MSTAGSAIPAATAVIPVIGSPITDDISTEGFSLLQKGFFLAVILGCVAVYMRMNNKKTRRFDEKSMA